MSIQNCFEADDIGFENIMSNNDTLDSNKLEHQQLDDYDTFINRGIFAGSRISQGFRLIQMHTIYDVKVDGRHKRRVVTDGHLTATLVESLYLGVISLRSLFICVFIGKLDSMIQWATDIGNAYLKAKTTKKVWWVLVNGSYLLADLIFSQSL